MIRRWRVAVAWALTLAAGSVAAWGAQGGITLAQGGKTTYRIVATQTPEVQAAAHELQAYLRRISGASFPAVLETCAKTEYEIVLGNNARLGEMGITIDWEKLGEGGYVIRTKGKRLVIAGGPRRGTINGVYGFLEDVLACRWFAPDVTVVPERDPLEIGPLDLMEVPSFSFRRINETTTARDLAWCAHLRLNAAGPNQGQGALLEDWLFVNHKTWAVSTLHTLTKHPGMTWPAEVLIPPALFDEHPEYFAQVGGKRVRDGQPCLTNREAAMVAAKTAKEWLRREPKATLIDVTPSDRGDRWCECAKCEESYQKYERPGYGNWCRTATLVRFVNIVADEIAEEFPDVKVVTIAYNATDPPPPDDCRIADNVVIMYCPIGVSWNYPLTGPHNEKHALKYTRIKKFAQLCKESWVFYYAQPWNALVFYPDMPMWSTNFKLMRDAGAKGVHVLVKPAYFQVLLAELRVYILAHLMWNADYDVDKGVEEFCESVYGEAKDEMLRFVKTVYDQASYSGYVRGQSQIADELNGGMSLRTMAQWRVTEEVLRELDALFDKAIEKGTRPVERVRRLQVQRVCLDYHILSQLDHDDPLWKKAKKHFVRWVPLAYPYGSIWHWADGKKNTVAPDEFIERYLGGR